MEESEITMIFGEIKKILLNKFFYIGLIVLFAINAVVFISFCRSSETGLDTYSPNEYRSVFDDLKDVDSEEEYLDTYLESVYSQTEEKGTEFKYTGDYFKESMLIEDILRNYRNCGRYAEIIDERVSNLRNIQTLGMTNLMNDYQRKNLDKKITRCEDLKNIKVEAGPSKGIEKIVNYRVVDFIILAFLLLIVVIIFTNERDNRMILLYKTAKNGRSEFIFSKIGICLISIVFALALFWGFNLICANQMLGFGKLSRSIQSIAGMELVPYKVSILEYIELTIGFKFLFYFAMVLMALIAAICSSSAIKLYICVAGGFGVGALLYYLIPENSYWSVFKYLNPYAPVYSIEFMNNYQNVNVIGTPIPVMPVLAVVLVIIIAVATILIQVVFSEQKEVEKNSVSSGRKFKSIFSGKHTNSFIHEVYKTLINGKVIFLLAGFAIVSVFTYKSVNEMFYIVEDRYEKYYIEQLRGRVDADKLAFLESERERYVSIQQKIDEAAEKGDELMLSAYSGKMESYSAFNKIYNEVTPHLVNVDGDYFDTTGAKLLTVDIKSKNKNIVLALMFAVICIFPLSYLFAQDYQYGMNTLVTSTCKGKKKTLRNKIILAIMVVITAYIITYLPYYRAVFSEYGFADMGFKARSIEYLSNLPDGFTVGGYFVFINAMRIVGMALVILLSIALGKYVKNIINVMLILAVLLIFPLLFAYFDMPGAKYYGFNPFLIGNLFASI